MSGKIKPCPLCGADAPMLIDEREEFVAEWGEDGWGQEAILDRLNRNPSHAVVCSAHKGGCGASGGWRPTEAEAVEAWNRRSDLGEADSWEMEGGKITAIWYGDTRYVREGA